MKFQVMSILIVFYIIFGCTDSTESNQKPNVIVIFTDDQGYSDLGIQKIADDIRTPNIDKLAEDGVLMKSGYVTAPQCIPSRAGLLTGRYQQRFGLDDNGTIPLPLSETIFPKLLKNAGYVTGMTGKWHLEPNHVQSEWLIENMPELKGNTVKPGNIPFDKKLPYMSSEIGFDEVFQGNTRRYWANFNLNGDKIEKQFIEDSRYRLDVQSDAAIAFIKRNQKNPFFLYLSYFAPHVPMEATEKYLSRFKGDMPTRRKYCLAMMSAIDDGVGRVVRTLKDNGLYENTLIFYLSDNGAPIKMDYEDKPISYVFGAWDGSFNEPYVGEKGMLSEGGIRIPFIVSWPKKLPKGKIYDQPVISLDIAATSLAAAGLPENNSLDGVNLLPYLTGSETGNPHEALYWRFWDQSAIRIGKWKFLKAGKREFLFDLSSAVHERNNIIGNNKDKAEELKNELIKWADEMKNPGLYNDEVRREKEWFDFYFPEKP